jgi:serine protease inhibitor
VVTNPQKTVQINIFKKIAKNNKENILISPISISLALSLAANGGVGETQEEMVQVLKPDDPHIASINEECKDLVEHYQKFKQRCEASHCQCYLQQSHVN